MRFDPGALRLPPLRFDPGKAGFELGEHDLCRHEVARGELGVACIEIGQGSICRIGHTLKIEGKILDYL